MGTGLGGLPATNGQSFVNLADLLRSQAAEHGPKPLVRWRDQRLTYAEFDRRTDEIAAGLARRGVGPGDVVSVMLPNSVAFVEAWWGILKAGGVFGPVNPTFTAAEAAYVVGHSAAVAVVTDRSGAERLAEVGDELPGCKQVFSLDDGSFDALRCSDTPVPDPRRDESDLAALLYTSGTTGRPKGAMITHGNVLANGWMAAELVPLAPGDRLGLILPLFHANAQIATFIVPMLVGCEVVMWDRFSASTFWTTVAELEPVSISAVPTILAAVLNAPGAATASSNSMRYVICGAAPLSKELLEAFQNRFGIRILEGYGLTESTCVSSLNPYYGPRKPGSIGLPVRGQQMEIRTEAGERASSGERGEIVIRGANIMAGYLNSPEATEATIRDGWLHTGDIGYEDPDGYFYIVDRTKDMIIRGGENIYPREIEEVLYEYGGVLECAVIGIPDEHRGEEVLAIVAAQAGAELDIEEMLRFAGARLAPYKLPRGIELIAELPKTPTGKISKGPLRERYGHWARPR